MIKLQEVLNNWNCGKTITSISMGGLGDAYEMVIQNCTWEIINQLIDRIDEIKNMSNDDINELFSNVYQSLETSKGSTGAQMCAANNLAYHMLIDGYDEVLEELSESRHIMVKKYDQ